MSTASLGCACYFSVSLGASISPPQNGNPYFVYQHEHLMLEWNGQILIVVLISVAESEPLVGF